VRPSNRRRADLLQQSKQVGLAVFFNNLSVGDTIEIHRLDLDLLSRRRNAKKAPLCVPRMVKRAATLSPSAINSSSVHWMSGKPARIIPMIAR
jgi:hypothetical protein